MYVSDYEREQVAENFKKLKEKLPEEKDEIIAYLAIEMWRGKDLRNFNNCNPPYNPYPYSWWTINTTRF